MATGTKSAPPRGHLLARRPVLAFWLLAIGIEVILGVAFLVTGAGDRIDQGLSRAGLEFGSDLITAARVVVAYPPAALGVLLALGQVAAPDLAIVAVSGIAGIGGRRQMWQLRQVGRRLRPWSREVGARRGVVIWLGVVAAFTACNLASGVLHRALLPEHLDWRLSWSMLPLLGVAVFLDAGALLEENGWRGFALPVLLRSHGPIAASVLIGLAWASWHFPVKFDAFIDYGLWGAMAYLGAFSLKLVALSVVMTYFWAQAGQATLLAVAMHGLSNDVARVGGLTDGSTWQVATVSELNLAIPFLVLAAGLVVRARRHGWGDLHGFGADAGPRPSGLA